MAISDQKSRLMRRSPKAAVRPRQAWSAGRLAREQLRRYRGEGQGGPAMPLGDGVIQDQFQRQEGRTDDPAAVNPLVQARAQIVAIVPARTHSQKQPY